MNGLFGFGGSACGGSCGSDYSLWLLLIMICCCDMKDCLCEILPLLLLVCCCSGKKCHADEGCGC